MFRRMAAALLALLLPLGAWAEAPAPTAEPTPPQELRLCTSSAEAAAFVDYPPQDALGEVQRGRIRYICQHAAGDDTFRKAYWLGGEEGSALDLTLQKDGRGRKYEFHVGNMCTRAAYSMALSYLGVDVTPGSMSAMTGKRNLNAPYKSVSKLVGVEGSTARSHVFDTLMNNYLTDPDYSPVYLYFRKPDGGHHALLVVAAHPEKSRYSVVDPSAVWKNGEPVRIFMIALNKTRSKIVNSTFPLEYAGSKILAIYQWKLPDAAKP